MNRFYLPLALAFFVHPVFAASRPPEPIQYGNVWMGNMSIKLDTGFSYGNSTKYITFTTFGKGAPLLFREPGEKYFEGSGEFRPSMTMTGYYESRYVVFDWPDTNADPKRLEYGSIYLQQPVTDANANQIPDIAERRVGFSGVSAGIIMHEWVAPGESRVTKDNYTFNFSRNAGADGMYSTDLIGSKITAFGGVYGAWDASGSMRYQRSDRLGYFDFYGVALDSGLAFANTRYRRLDSTQLRVNPFTLRVGMDRVLSGSAMTMHRVSGDTYRGMFTARDGNSETRFSDYRWFVVEVKDPNDSDHDNISDLAEPLSPYIFLQPKSVTVPEGGTAIFRAGAL